MLGAVVALPVVAACTPAAPDAAPAPTPTTDPDVSLGAQAAARERTLLASYDAAILAAPALADKLGPLRAEHATHLTAIAAQTPPSARPLTPQQTPPTSPPPPTAAAAPADPAVVLASLTQAERTAAVGHGDAAIAAGRALAAVLAAVAASEASHPVALA